MLFHGLTRRAIKTIDIRRVFWPDFQNSALYIHYWSLYNVFAGVALSPRLQTMLSASSFSHQYHGVIYNRWWTTDSRRRGSADCCCAAATFIVYYFDNLLATKAVDKQRIICVPIICVRVHFNF